jgi:NifU-like protein involved in Fe-S cluster formation
LDEAAVRYYRKLITDGFRFAGRLDEAAITLDAASENMRICDHVGTDSLQLFFSIQDGVVDKVRYLCMCDPTTNVTVEIFCVLAEGKSLQEIRKLTPDSFLKSLGGPSQNLEHKAENLLLLVEKGIAKYLHGGNEGVPGVS